MCSLTEDTTTDVDSTVVVGQVSFVNLVIIEADFATRLQNRGCELNASQRQHKLPAAFLMHRWRTTKPRMYVPPPKKPLTLYRFF